MELDIATLLLVLVLCNLVMAGALWVAFSEAFHNGLEKWGVSLLLQADSWAMFLIDTLWPGFNAVLAGHTLLCASLTLQAGGLLEFRQRRAALAWLFGPPLALVLVNLGLRVHPPTAAALTNVIQAACCIVIMHVLLTDDRHHRRGTLWLMTTAYLLMLLIFGAHAGFTLGDHELAMLIQPAQWPSVCVLASIVYVVVASFGFLLLQKESAEADMHKLATMDPLTGVFNRRTFIELAERELARCRRSNSPLRLLMLDLDHFKRINDTYGHLVGDDVIREFASTVADCLRREDLLVRYGGEEFCILLPGADESTALALAERIRATVDNRRMKTRDGLLHVTTSIGICGDEFSNIDSLDNLLNCADRALYLAKAGGRNQVMASTLSTEGSQTVAASAAR